MKRIFDMIRKGSKYIVRENLGRAFDKYVQDDKEDYYLLVPNIHVMDRKSLNRIFERYYIHEIFDIANCYLGSFNEPFMYWHLSKHPRSEIYVAIFYGYAHPYRDNEANVTGKLRIPSYYVKPQSIDFSSFFKSLTIGNTSKTEPMDMDILAFNAE